MSAIVVPSPEKTTAAESRASKWRSDILAGLVNAVVSVPDGLASAALAGVNPIYGLYTSIAAPIAGSAIVSAQLMQIATTSASALVAGQAIAVYPADQRSEPPKLLPSNAATVLDVEGSLFFAGARTLFDALPAVGKAKRPVVILRLRGYTRVGATLIDVLDEYANALAEAGGRLYLTGVDENVARQLRRAGKLDLDNVVHLVPADAILGASTRQAVEHASGFWKSSAERND